MSTRPSFQLVGILSMYSRVHNVPDKLHVSWYGRYLTVERLSRLEGAIECRSFVKEVLLFFYSSITDKMLESMFRST